MSVVCVCLCLCLSMHLLYLSLCFSLSLSNERLSAGGLPSTVFVFVFVCVSLCLSLSSEKLSAGGLPSVVVYWHHAAPPAIGNQKREYFYRTQVYLGSDLWVRVSVTE